MTFKVTLRNEGINTTPTPTSFNMSLKCPWCLWLSFPFRQFEMEGHIWAKSATFQMSGTLLPFPKNRFILLVQLCNYNIRVKACCRWCGRVREPYFFLNANCAHKGQMSKWNLFFFKEEVPFPWVDYFSHYVLYFGWHKQACLDVATPAGLPTYYALQLIRGLACVSYLQYTVSTQLKR